MHELIKGHNPQGAVWRILAIAAVAALAACSNVKSFDYTAIDEIPPGRGLLSGGDGVFVLYPLEGTGKDE